MIARLYARFDLGIKMTRGANKCTNPKTRRLKTMNWDQISGKWKQFTGKAREKWGKLTDDDLEVIKGDRDQLIGKIQERYGYSREQAEREADEWQRGL